MIPEINFIGTIAGTDLDGMGLLTAFAAGVAVGAFYFAGLWWTVRRMAGGGGPLFAAASFLIRAAVALPLLYYSAGGRWEGILTATLGFLGARSLFVRGIGRVDPRLSPETGGRP